MELGEISFLDRGRSCVFVTEVLKLKSALPPHAPGLVLRLPQISLLVL
jgi:hypothetical protein